jgi:magnesium chelatase family protein
MLARAHTFAIDGVHARRVCVELDIRSGLPTFNVVGLSNRVVRDARERVRAAILNAGYDFPRLRVTANLAPANLEKSGPTFDLAIACAVLAASDQIAAPRLTHTALFAELSLSGELRACRGALAAAEAAAGARLHGLVVAAANAAEAAQVERLPVVGARTLREVAALLSGEGRLPHRVRAQPRRPSAPTGAVPDLADVRGQAQAIEALTIAAAGGHHVLMSGPPGVGKTMLARRLPSILPPLERAEAIEVTKIHSVAGAHIGGGLVQRRPFRAPHHTISAAGLIGGGPNARPGEAVLAHRGVLFLDELSEFSRAALEGLRQPLEDNMVAIVRRQHTAVYPTRFMLVAAANPCPCGYAGEEGRCRCRPTEVATYRRKLSGPLLDRLELLGQLRRPTAGELRAPASTCSAVVAKHVWRARQHQRHRLRGTSASCNAELDLALLNSHGRICAAAQRRLSEAYDRGSISARGHVRVMRVARTVADLDDSAEVKEPHVLLALSLHPEGRLM